MKGKSNHSLIKDGKFISYGKTLDLYAMYDMGSFPIVSDEHEISHIYGEIWRIDKKSFDEVADLEARLYYKDEVPIQLYDSGTLKSWIWMAEDEVTDGILIREGIWR